MKPNNFQQNSPTEYPVSRQTAKDHLRIDSTDEDSLVDLYIAAATDYAEEYTGRAFIQRQITANFGIFASFFELPKPPLISVTSIKYYDSDNVQQTVAASNYNINLSIPAKIDMYPKGNMPSTYERPDAVEVIYEAGYEPNETVSPVDSTFYVPASARAAILLIMADMFQNREGQALVIGARYEANQTVKNMLDRYRINRSL